MYQKQRTTKSYSITSPYMQLLQSKKKVYGLKYHSSIGGNASHSKSTHNQNTLGLNSSSVKGRPASSSLASHHNKSGMKSNSSQKVKSTKSQNPKKKRIYTQQGQNFNQLSSDPKMHESLFVNMEHKNGLNELATKSLFPNEPSLAKHNNYINNYDFLKKFSEFNAQLRQKQHQHINFSGSKSQKSNKSAKSRNKSTKPPHHPHNRSITFQNILLGKSIQGLNLTQVQDLICLIDNCVQQANQYISFLASKVQSLKNQLMKCKAQQFQLQRIIKEKNKQIEGKDGVISRLRKQVEVLKGEKVVQNATTNVSQNYSSTSGQEQFKSKQMKKILQVLNEMNQRNQYLQSKVKGLQNQLTKQTKPKHSLLPQRQSYQQQQYFTNNQFPTSKHKQKRKNSSSNSKQVYNQIHSKIDILNISIDNNKKTTQNSNNYTYESDKSQQKKYKFIKPKNGK